MEFNHAPYFDDFDQYKKYLSVLFKSGYDVQARELNVLQSMKQHQIGSLGNHLFKNGAKIAGCANSFVQYDYVRVNDTHNKISKYNNEYKIVGRTSKVEATIISSHPATPDEDPIFLVMYTKSGGSQEQVFIPNETIDIIKNGVIDYTITVRDDDPLSLIKATGKSLVFIIDEGIFFYNNYFLKVQKQSIIITRYLTKDSNGAIISDEAYRVGLDIVEDIITVDEDKSLADPSFNSPNFGGPGADRYQVNLYLSIRDYIDDGETTNFILLAKVRQNHDVVYKKDDTEYGEIMKELARRTYETYGDFTMIPWKARFLNEKKKDAKDTMGWSLNGDPNKYVAIVTPGEGYVKGYRIQTKSDTIVSGRKAIDTGTLTGQKTAVGIPKSIIVDSTTVADWGLDGKLKFNLYDVNNNLTGMLFAYDVYKIGNTRYQIYIYNVNPTPGGHLEETVKLQLIGGSFVGTCAPGSLTNAISYDSSNLIPTGIKNICGIDNVSLKVRTRYTGILDSNGSITFGAPSDGEFFQEDFYIAWVDLNGVKTNIGNSAITVTDDELTISVGSTFSTAAVTIMATVGRTDLDHREKVKTLQTLNIAGNNENSKSGHALQLKYDVSSIESVTLVLSNGSEIDITQEYTLELSNNPNMYQPALLRRRVFRRMTSAEVIVVKYIYFEHGANGSYFSINSYAPEDLKDAPLYNGQSSADFLDFRVDISDNSNSYFKAIPVPGSIIQFDAIYMMSRADLLLVDIDGNFYIKEGVPGKGAKLPNPDPDTMAIHAIYLDPLTDIEKTSTSYYDNKRYLIKDIRRLEKRISNAEDAVALNMLELSTINMSIKDQDGFDRYKNGFLVDNFKTFHGSDLANYEYRASLDRNNGLVRPEFKQNNVRLKLDENKSSNIKVMGGMVIKNYQDDLFIQNPFATQSVSINPYMIYCTRGSMTLSPNIDTWAEDQYKPNIVADIDTGVDALRQAAERGNFIGNDYGAWVNYNTSIATNTSTVSTSTSAISGNNNVTTTTNVNTTTTTRTTDQSRSVTSTFVGSEMQSYQVDGMVTDIAIIPYIRANTIQFYASNLKPNTRVYAFFDGVDVNLHCRAITQIDTTTGDVLVNRNASMFGTSSLISDDDGNLVGEFRIPANTFFTGEKKFVLTNDPNNTGNPDIETTRCESTYFAGGVSQTKQNAVMNVITPTFGTISTTENRSISTTSTSVSRDVSVSTVAIPQTTAVSSNGTSEIPPMPPRKPGYSSIWHWVWQGGKWVWDPVAQGFKVEESCFISKVDVYFDTVDDKADIIWFEIREMFNGYPTNTAISRHEIKGADLKKYESKDASVPYPVVWDVPVYVDSSKSYAFVVGGFSPDTRVFMSKLGSKLLNSDKILEAPPLPHTMFRSLNGDTWNAEQFDTMKINLYRCVFDSNPAEVYLHNDGDTLFEIPTLGDPIELQKNSNRVRIYAKNHNLRVNDRAVINFSRDMYYTIETTNSGIPQIGQPISTLSGSGYVKDVKSTATLNVYDITIEKMIGVFKAGEEFVCESRNYVYRDLLLASRHGAAGSPIVQTVVLGNVKSGSNNIPDDIAGASIELFAKEHIVREVDSSDTFIIEVEAPFNNAGRFGGDNVNIYGNNIKYDVFNIAGQYLPYNCKEEWSLTPHAYGPETLDDVNFLIAHDVNMDHPGVILSLRNEQRILGKEGHSVGIKAKFTSTSPYLSPVLNVDSFSMTTISNRIDLIDPAIYNKVPKANRLIDETDPLHGNELYKHITTKVLLQNAAVDMKIIVDVHLPPETDFDIYVKINRVGEKSGDDSLPWYKVDKYTKVNTSFKKDDYIAYSLLLSENCSAWNNKIEYISYRVKLVGRSGNSCTPPIFKNLRAIAIT